MAASDASTPSPVNDAPRGWRAKVAPRAFGRLLGLQLVQSLAETGFRTIAVLVTARAFEVETYGLLALVLSAAGVHQLLMDGVWSSVVKTVSEAGADGDSAQAWTGWRAANVSTWAGVGLLLPLLAIFALVSPGSFAESGALVWLGAGYALAVNAKVSLEAAFRGLQRFGPPALWGVAIAPVQAAWLIHSALTGGGVGDYVAILAGTTAFNAAALALHFMFGVLRHHPRTTTPRGRMKEMLAYSGPLVARSGLSWFALRVNPVLVALWAGTEAAGFYGLTEKFLMIPLLAIGAFVNAVAPRISRASAEGTLPALSPFLARVYGALLLTMLPATAAFLLNDPAIDILFPQYEGAKAAVRAFGPMLIIVGWAGIAQMGLLVQGGLGRVSTVITAIQALANIALLAWWVPQWGATGAAAATAISSSLAGVACLVIAHRRLGVRFGVRMPWG